MATMLPFLECVSEGNKKRRQVVVSLGKSLYPEDGTSAVPLVVFQQEASASSFRCKNDAGACHSPNCFNTGDDKISAGTAPPAAPLSPLPFILGDKNSLSALDTDEESINLCNGGEIQPPAVTKEVLVPSLPAGLKAVCLYLKCTNCKHIHLADPSERPSKCFHFNCQSSGELVLFRVEIKCDLCKHFSSADPDDMPESCSNCPKRRGDPGGHSGGGGVVVGNDSNGKHTRGADNSLLLYHLRHLKILRTKHRVMRVMYLDHRQVAQMGLARPTLYNEGRLPQSFPKPQLTRRRQQRMRWAMVRCYLAKNEQLSRP